MIVSLVADYPEVKEAAARLDRATPSTHYDLVRARDKARARMGIPVANRAFLYSAEVDDYLLPIVVRMWPSDEDATVQALNDVVQKLLRKARKGARLIYVPGNHDEFLRDYYGTSATSALKSLRSKYSEVRPFTAARECESTVRAWLSRIALNPKVSVEFLLFFPRPPVRDTTARRPRYPVATGHHGLDPPVIR
jgi:hypothetical protein